MSAKDPLPEASSGQAQSIYIFDSFALLAFLEGEASKKVVQGILEEAQYEA